MIRNVFIYVFITGLLFLPSSLMSQPPYYIDKVISENKITSFGKQKLLIIDFWATWCAPCAPATEQLEILQKSKSNDVFVVSVSDEEASTIANYMQRRPIKLTVMKDYLPMSLINLFDVQRRPYSVLLNLDGQVLFSGHPSDITASMIDKYASQVKSRPVKAWADLFTVKSSQPASAVPVQKGAGEVTVKKTSETSKWMYSESGMFYYSGTISDLIKLLSDCSPYQVQLSGMSDYGVTMTCSDVDFISSKTKLLQTVKEKLSLNIHTESKTLSATILNVAVPNKLWSDKHINWGYDATQTYIVGADRIEANNLTINQMANILSDVKGKFYYYKGYDTSLHDWSIHYLYENLMKEDLTSTFGITLTNEKVEVPVFIVSPK